MSKAHAKLHDIILDKSNLLVPKCQVCNRFVLEIDSPNFRKFYRHKPDGYKWGDKARKYEAAYRALVDKVKQLPKEYHYILEDNSND